MKTNGEQVEGPGERLARRLLAMALALAPLLAALPSPAQPVPAPPHPAVSAATVVSPALARKVRESRAMGVWVVEEGDYLYRICRLFARDEAQAGRLARELRERNPGAFVAGDPDRLIAGARLSLPAWVLDEPQAGPARAEPATAPSPAPFAPPAAAPAAPVPAAAPAAAYVDRLIEGLPSAEAERRLDAAPVDTTPGLRSTALEFRLDRRNQNVSGVGLSQGLALRHRAETERHGDVTLEAEMGRERQPSRGPDGRVVGRATLYHDQFALGSAWVANSALGSLRLGLSPWLASSFRVFLPSSIAAGAATSIEGPGVQIRAGVGRLGRLSGVAIQHFEMQDGTLAQLEAAGRLSESWQVGGAVASVQGAGFVRDHTAATLATEFRLPASGAQFKLQGLADDRGEHGFWVDGQYRRGRFAQRFGLFHLDPDLVFGEGALARDSRGAYWRGDYRGATLTSTLGAEATQTNLDRDPARGGLDSAGGFANLALKLDRSTQVGAGLAHRAEKPRTEAGVRRRVDLFNLFASRHGLLGVTRLDVALHRTDPRGLPLETARTYTWSQDWPRWGGIEINTLLALSDERLADRDIRRTTASLGVRGQAAAGLRWDVTLTAVDVDDPLAPERNYNAAVGLDWAAARDWTVRLQWLRNEIEPASSNTLTPFVRENALQLTARYEESRGVPYPRVGGAAGRSGAGAIEGMVFFDENGDGVRQANERGAANVMVVLDNRSTQVTDGDGRFVFGLVPSGPHQVTIGVDRVPLPWGLADEAPRAVRVEVRETVRVDVGLTRIAP